MCIDKNGTCLFCGRSYPEQTNLLGDECLSDDCPSHSDLIAVWRDSGEMKPFYVSFNGESYSAVVPDSLENLKRNFISHMDCKAYLVNLAYCFYLWSDFGSAPLNEDDELDVEWFIFSKGTAKYTIWHWFEDSFNVSLAEDLMYHSMMDIKLVRSPQYQVIFDSAYYAEGQDLEKMVDPEFFSPANGYDTSAFKAVIGLPFLGSVTLDNGFQSVVRLD